ncbi:LytR/AlgR family response regulator transcription factor [Aureibacter tunicatorum]|uniref:DNA-binding LytR/AlgR family response regulator n=1 Tax=Aureibacter tunicatorum TaxID=866807 RepID=A0AAE3XPK7_9BACT|nr:LytTR family DNA-binding domain-containing protein [Aureibacter tunicatorum]MDR6238939.1 DNA-binding LytR/AlgR family response regulator [Aureibacter tunicatorum]BDD05135.1 DNA-binding response regulator [Aureibacter tunicatorum]
MKYVIIEDEKPNARMLEMYISELRPKWSLVSVFDRVTTFVEYFSKSEYPDLIFMDIQLKDGLCFEIFDKLDVECPIVFTTAFDQYAIRAFEVNSIDYLLKPVEEDKLLHAFEKFEKLHAQDDEVSEKVDYSRIMETIKNGTKVYRNRFMVSGPKSYFKIDVKEIAFFKSEGGACLAHMFDGKEHVLEQTLEKLEFQLDPEHFFRANRGVILNIDAIDNFEPYFGGKLTVNLKKDICEPITVSRLKANSFKSWVDAW